MVCEVPLDEIWQRIGRFASVEYLRRTLQPRTAGINWDHHTQYTALRLQQAIEFRGASRAATILTRPLTLYYSFLHITRAFLALGPEIISRPGHGLKLL